ncbi:MAG: flagellar type III secretion system pore protein FliP [Nitrospiraceae bacterium]|nr:flagellar type III secretion system pore protein FliP [Nitrospiraceae bacterium]MDA8090853.1 flagellar type III secretion system pore protein FliP [Nitrospiraceae bacterium]
MSFGSPNSLVGVFFLISFLSVLPAILIMFTSFTRIVIVLSFMRQAIGGQQIPPNTVIIGLSIFLTLFIMSPTLNTITKDALNPYIAKQIPMQVAFDRAAPPIKTFMLKQTRQKDLALFVKIGREDHFDGLDTTNPQALPLRVIVPAFVISELKTAFEIGFLIYLPFLVIDMIVSSILLSMGMMMLPPALISLPFKLLLFVLVDGWNLVTGSIIRSFH